MLETARHTLPKKERLCRKTLIDQLFLGHSQRKKEWPIKVVYQVVERKDEQDSSLEVMVSVSKRCFKRAVKRNLVKRQMREGFRKHRFVLDERLFESKNVKLLMAFVWMDANLHSTEEVEETMAKLMDMVALSFANDTDKTGK